MFIRIRPKAPREVPLTVPVREPEPPPDVVELLREADQRIAEGELERAGLLVSQAAVLEPDRAGLHYVRSRLFHARGETEVAVKTLEQACRLRPDVATWHGVRGSLLLELGRPDLAVEAFRQSLELEPDSDAGRAGLEEALRLQAARGE